MGQKNATGMLLEKLVPLYDEWSEEPRSDPLFFDAFAEYFPYSPRTYRKCKEVSPIVGKLGSVLKKERPGALCVKVNSSVKVGPKMHLPQTVMEAKEWLPGNQSRRDGRLVGGPGVALFVCSKECIPESAMALFATARFRRMKQINGNLVSFNEDAINPVALPPASLKALICDEGDPPFTVEDLQKIIDALHLQE